MKILYYSAHPHLSMGAQTGAGTHMREMINAMRDLGHEVLPLIMGDRLCTEKRQHVSPPPCIMKRMVKKLVPGIVWRSLKEKRLLRFDQYAEDLLSDTICLFKPDLVYERAAYMQISGVRAAKRHRIPHFMEINAPFAEEMRKFEKQPTIWMKKIKKTEQMQVCEPEKVYVVSSALKDYYMQYTPDASKIDIIPNCVNTHTTKCDEDLRVQLVKHHALAGKTVIGFVGSVFPYHGVDTLIRAFAGIARTSTRFVLMIVGDGMIMPELKALSAKLGLAHQVIFTGSVKHNEVFSYISLMDVTVMAQSNWYGSPVKLFEYGAMKKPIIAPLTTPVTDVMQPGIDALLVKPGEKEVARALGTMLAHKQLRNMMAKTFYRKVVHMHTWKHAAQKVLSSAIINASQAKQKHTDDSKIQMPAEIYQMPGLVRQNI